MAVTASVYSWAIQRLGQKLLDLDSDTFKVILGNSSMTFSETHDDYADISANENSTANGYTAGGATLGSVTWTRTAPDNFWDAADASWTASGAGLSADNAATYDDTHASDALMSHINFGGTQTAGAGATFVIAWNASGIMKI